MEVQTKTEITLKLTLEEAIILKQAIQNVETLDERTRNIIEDVFNGLKGAMEWRLDN